MVARERIPRHEGLYDADEWQVVVEDAHVEQPIHLVHDARQLLKPGSLAKFNSATMISFHNWQFAHLGYYRGARILL